MTRRAAVYVRELTGIWLVGSLTLVLCWAVLGVWAAEMFLLPDLLNWCVGAMTEEPEQAGLIEYIPTGCVLAVFWFCGLMIWTWDKAISRVCRWARGRQL